MTSSSYEDFVPSTLDEAVDLVLSNMTEADKDAYAMEDPECPGAKYHHFGGMAMRNDWGLWYHETPLAQWFARHGIYMADDRSAVVFKALYCRLTGRSFDIGAEAMFYQQFWREHDCYPDGSPRDEPSILMRYLDLQRRSEAYEWAANQEGFSCDAAQAQLDIEREMERVYPELPEAVRQAWENGDSWPLWMIPV